MEALIPQNILYVCSLIQLNIFLFFLFWISTYFYRLAFWKMWTSLVLFIFCNCSTSLLINKFLFIFYFYIIFIWTTNVLSFSLPYVLYLCFTRPFFFIFIYTEVKKGEIVFSLNFMYTSPAVHCICLLYTSRCV